MAVLFIVTSGRIWGRALQPNRWLLASVAASLPLLYLRQSPWVWLAYALVVCGLTGWLTFIRPPRDSELARAGRVLGTGSRLASAAAGRMRSPRQLPTDRPLSVAGTGGSSPQRRPRVYLLTSHPVAPPWSGADKNLARALLTAELGYDFTFVGDRADSTVWPLDHERRALPFATGIPTSREQLRLFWWLFRDRPDVDILHAIITFRPSLAKESGLLSLPVLRSSRLVVTCPSGHHLPHHVLRRAHAAVAVSRRTELELRRTGAHDVHRIAPGIDLCSFRPAAAAEGWRRLRLSPRPTIFFAGHYDPGGGLDAAVDVLRRVRRRVPSVRLLTAMRTRPGAADRRRRTDAEARVRALGLADAVVPLGATADVRSAIWASAAVLFQPSHLGIKMDLPMTLLEALACGRPVLVSPVDSLGELADASGAVAVERPEATGTVDQLERLLTDLDYAATCGHAARTLAERRYSVQGMVAAYADLYRSVLTESSSAIRARTVLR
jgi:glycosyltransferase involved in cell wall biosynthesis